MSVRHPRSLLHCLVSPRRYRFRNTAMLRSGFSVQTLQTTSTSLPVESSDAAADDEFPNPFLPDLSRTAFLRKRLFARQDQWSERRKIKYVLLR